MNQAEREALIDQYEDGHRAVEAALAGISAAELEAREGPGEWSPREIVHHLADSEMTAAVRLRFVVAADSPRIQGYDQDEFARRLHYDRPTEASLELFKAARRATAELMERMTEAEWSREGTHSEHGRYTLPRWLEIYADHAHKHAEQILIARDAARGR